MARPRNHISKLPHDIRCRIFNLINDGIEYDAVRADPQITESCFEHSLRLHNSTFLAYQNSQEYKTLYEMASKQFVQKDLRCPKCDTKFNQTKKD